MILWWLGLGLFLGQPLSSIRFWWEIEFSYVVLVCLRHTYTIYQLSLSLSLLFFLSCLIHIDYYYYYFLAWFPGRVRKQYDPVVLHFRCSSLVILWYTMIHILYIYVFVCGCYHYYYHYDWYIFIQNSVCICVRRQTVAVPYIYIYIHVSLGSALIVYTSLSFLSVSDRILIHYYYIRRTIPTIYINIYYI